MRIVKEGKFKLLIAETGYHIRRADDIPTEEHIPYYSEMIYVSKDLTDEEINDLYIEELKEQE